MGKETFIEWVDSTLNLQMGCRGCELWNPSQGVKRCYAGMQSAAYAGNKGWPVRFEEPVIFAERLAEALRWPDLTGQKRLAHKAGQRGVIPAKSWLDGYPRLIFLNDMGDTFTEGLPDNWLAPFIDDMAASPHRFLFLTKRVRRMVEFFRPYHSLPQNFWLGTSITGPASGRRLKELGRLVQEGNSRAAVLFASFEPLSGEQQLTPSFHDDEITLLDWLIAGGESGVQAQPAHPVVFRDLRDVCRDEGIPFFFKQWGEWTHQSQFLPDGSSVRALRVKDLEPQRAHHWSSGSWSVRLGRELTGNYLDGAHHLAMPVEAGIDRPFVFKE